MRLQRGPLAPIAATLLLLLSVLRTSSAFSSTAPQRRINPFPSTLTTGQPSRAAASFVLQRPSSGAAVGTTTSSTLNLAPLDQLDHDALHSALTSASSFLADAAEAAVEAEKSSGGGWWESYLNVFKSALIFVHSNIDGPLRSVGVTQTWGVSIALFTAAVRASLIPLSIQQTKSSEYMKALKPYVDEIKTKFKDKQETQNRAIAKLYEDAGQNPLAGCLVSLSQIPIFLGLYRSVTLLAKDGALQEPFLWIPSLEGPVTGPTYRGMEWLTEGWTQVDGFPTPSLGWETTLAFMAMPVILVLGQKITMDVLQPPVDDNMSDDEKEQLEKSQVILKFLPLMIGYFSLQVPAGLTIYWFTSNLFTLSQSLAVKSYYAANPPKIELPEYWDALDDVASMTPEERRKAAEAGIAAGPSFEEIMDEAKFHYVVQREPIREGSPAWERVHSNGAVVPEEMAAWVVGSGGSEILSSSSPPPTNSTQEVELAKA